MVIMGVIKEGVLTEAGSIIITNVLDITTLGSYKEHILECHSGPIVDGDYRFPFK